MLRARRHKQAKFHPIHMSLSLQALWVNSSKMVHMISLANAVILRFYSIEINKCACVRMN